MNSCSREELIAIGVAEFSPPPFPWRQLRIVYEFKADARRHLWAVVERDNRVVGYELPASRFEQLTEEGQVLRLPTPLPVLRGMVLVCTEEGRFEVRAGVDVAAARRRYCLSAVEEALHSYVDHDTDAAQGWLDRARLAEGKPQIVTVMRAGLAIRLGDKSDWAQTAMAEFKEEAPFIEFDIIRPSFFWDRLPHATIRNDWLSSAESIARDSFTLPPLHDLLPTPENDRKWAIWLLIARRTRAHQLFMQMRHKELVGIGSCDAAMLERWRSRLRTQFSDATDPQLLEHLKQLAHAACPGGELERLRSEIELRTQTEDLRHHAILVARLEATLGNGERQVAWRRSAAHLNRIAFQAGVAPWLQGEFAANELREHWGVRELAVKEVVSFARREVGLAAFASSFPGEEFESCHVIDRAVPPASYLNKDVATNAPRTRFALAQAIGLQALDPLRPGVRFYRSARMEQFMGASSEGEMAANAFAAYFLAPRRSVQSVTRPQQLVTPEGYREATQTVMKVFGLSFSAAFAHVANCHEQEPRFEWFERIGARLESFESDFAQDHLDVPLIPSGTQIPLERANGFASLLVRAVATGAVSAEEAPGLLGDDSASVREWLRTQVAQLKSPQLPS